MVYGSVCKGKKEVYAIFSLKQIKNLSSYKLDLKIIWDK